MHMKSLRKILALIASILLLSGFTMPFNGDIIFHEIALTIPSSYIRDSTQSHEDLYIFEKGWYSRCILLSRNNYSGNETEALENYARYMESVGADVQRVPFLQKSAVHSVYTKDDEFCQEMLFAYKGSLYAIALRGGNEAEFQILLDTVSLDPASFTERASSGENAAPSTPFGRIMEYLF